MIASAQVTSTEIFAFMAVLVLKLFICKVLFINRKDNRNCLKVGHFFKENSRLHFWITANLKIIGIWNLQDTFKTCKRSFISVFSIFITVLLQIKGQNWGYIIKKYEINKNQ